MSDITCYACLGVEELIDELKIDLEDFTELPVYIVGYAEKDKFVCNECEEYLEPKDMYFLNNDDKEVFIDTFCVKVGEILSEDIEYCSHCSNGQDVEYAIHRFEKEGLNYTAVGEEIYDFLTNYSLPEYLYENVNKNLVCSNCGYGTGWHPKHDPDNGKFEMLDRVYTGEEIDSFWGFEESFVEIAKKYDIDINTSELKEFEEFLFDKPLLAFRHTTGKKIYSTLETLHRKQEYYAVNAGEPFWRGRNRGKDKSQYSIKGLWSPPKGEASHGRYNPIGLSVLYCTDNKDGIPYEIEPKKNEVIDIATFTNNEALYLLDIDKIFVGFEGFLASESKESTSVRKGYLITNYIAVCCIDIGFDGVKYSGVSDLRYNNFAFFNPNQEKFIVQDSIEIIEVKARYH